MSFDLVNHAGLSQLSAAFASGAHVVLGTEWSGTGALVELAAGIAQPVQGRVTLGGKEPFLHAEVRRRVAALCAEERLPPGRTVTRSLATALSARGDSRSASSLLDAAGIAHFAARHTAELSSREARLLGLVLALSHPEPALLALFEPLALLGPLSEAFVLDGILRVTDAGAVVLCTASRVEDAARLGGAVSTLERGFWFDPRASELPLEHVTVRVLTPDPQRLAALLSEAADVLAVQWAGGPELLVRGTDLERVAERVVASARSAGIRIEALRFDPPSLEVLAATRAVLAQRWYEQAHERAEREAQAQTASTEHAPVPPEELH